MTQQKPELAVAELTDEDAAQNQRRGFRVVEPDDNDDLPAECRPPQIIDWDVYDLLRNTSVVEQPPSSLRCGTTRSRYDLTPGKTPLSL